MNWVPGMQYAMPVAECPAGSVITGGFSHHIGAWHLYPGHVLGNAWHQTGEATIIMDVDHYVEADAICLRLS